MIDSQAIAGAGHAIGQGIRDRKKNKQERAAITTRLGTLEQFKDRKDELEEYSLGDLRGLEESVLMKRAKEVEDQKAKMRAKQLEQLTQMIANQGSQEQRAQQSHALQMQLGGKQVGAFDANQDMKAQKHKLTMEQLAKSLEGPTAPQEILPGIYRAGLGNGNFQNIDLRPDPAEQPPGFTPVTLPDGSTAYNPSKGLNVNSLLNAEGKKLFAQSGNDLSALVAALTGEAPAAKQPPANGPQKGQIIQQGGKQYRFKGGDPNDPKNYEAL
jgi:hypothetical protein